MKRVSFDKHGKEHVTYEDDSRPYFTPLPADWPKHKHHIPEGKNHFSPIELSVIGFCATLERAGYFHKVPKKKEPPKNMEGPSREQLKKLTTDHELDA